VATGSLRKVHVLQITTVGGLLGMFLIPVFKEEIWNFLVFFTVWQTGVGYVISTALVPNKKALQ